MYKAGFRIITWGIESFNQRILDLMNKGTKARNIHRILRQAHKAGLKNMVYLIHYFPTQTKKEMLQDMEYLKKNKKYIYNATINKFWLEDGTWIFNHHQDFGLHNLKRSVQLNAKKGKLFHMDIDYREEKPVNFNSLERTKRRFIKNNHLEKIFDYDDSGFKITKFYPREHMLLHTTKGR